MTMLSVCKATGKRVSAHTQAGMALFSSKQIVRLTVGGMTCDGCVATVTRALESIPGVKKAKVDLDRGAAEITLGDPVDPSTLVGAVEGAGYDATTADA